MMDDRRAVELGHRNGKDSFVFRLTYWWRVVTFRKDDPELGRKVLDAMLKVPYGRAECAWCRADLGPRPDLKPGEMSHGMCAECEKNFDKRDR